ncbi:MAG: helix-turn-helix domain-containing protein [Oscillospiraceae bacterium]|nr:helix-turn-helix domain-containing protein [Oscillospiraceae bacterium]
MEFSEKLKELRAQKGISQAKLAADIHISRSAVAKWENGLGLPGEESLKLLAEYFGVSANELLPDKDNEENLVTKNRTINKQKKVIFGLVFGMGLSVIIFLCLRIEALREVMFLLGFGVISVTLGIFNMRGNIASIHWYNRRKVTKENQKPYCFFVGLGTLVIGVGMIVAGILQAFVNAETGAYFILGAILAGLSLILYAQIKYNRGIF